MSGPKRIQGCLWQNHIHRVTASRISTRITFYLFHQRFGLSMGFSRKRWIGGTLIELGEKLDQFPLVGNPPAEVVHNQFLIEWTGAAQPGFENFLPDLIILEDQTDGGTDFDFRFWIRKKPIQPEGTEFREVLFKGWSFPICLRQELEKCPILKSFAPLR